MFISKTIIMRRVPMTTDFFFKLNRPKYRKLNLCITQFGQQELLIMYSFDEYGFPLYMFFFPKQIYFTNFTASQSISNLIIQSASKEKKSTWRLSKLDLFLYQLGLAFTVCLIVAFTTESIVGTMFPDQWL